MSTIPCEGCSCREANLAKARRIRIPWRSGRCRPGRCAPVQPAFARGSETPTLRRLAAYASKGVETDSAWPMRSGEASLRKGDRKKPTLRRLTAYASPGAVSDIGLADALRCRQPSQGDPEMPTLRRLAAYESPGAVSDIGLADALRCSQPSQGEGLVQDFAQELLGALVLWVAVEQCGRGVL